MFNPIIIGVVSLILMPLVLFLTATVVFALWNFAAWVGGFDANL